MCMYTQCVHHTRVMMIYTCTCIFSLLLIFFLSNIHVLCMCGRITQSCNLRTYPTLKLPQGTYFMFMGQNFTRGYWRGFSIAVSNILSSWPLGLFGNALPNYLGVELSIPLMQYNLLTRRVAAPARVWDRIKGTGHPVGQIQPRKINHGAGRKEMSPQSIRILFPSLRQSYTCAWIDDGCSAKPLVVTAVLQSECISVELGGHRLLPPITITLIPAGLTLPLTSPLTSAIPYYIQVCT